MRSICLLLLICSTAVNGQEATPAKDDQTTLKLPGLPDVSITVDLNANKTDAKDTPRFRSNDEILGQMPPVVPTRSGIPTLDAFYMLFPALSSLLRWGSIFPAQSILGAVPDSLDSEASKVVLVLADDANGHKSRVARQNTPASTPGTPFNLQQLLSQMPQLPQLPQGWDNLQLGQLPPLPDNFNLGQMPPLPQLPDPMNLGQFATNMGLPSFDGLLGAPPAAATTDAPSTSDNVPAPVVAQSANPFASFFNVPGFDASTTLLGAPPTPDALITGLRQFWPTSGLVGQSDGDKSGQSSDISEVRMRPDGYGTINYRNPQQADAQMAQLKINSVLQQQQDRQHVPLLWFRMPNTDNEAKNKPMDQLEIESKLQSFERQVIDELKLLQQIERVAKEMRTNAQDSTGTTPTEVTHKQRYPLSHTPVHKITRSDIERALRDDYVRRLLNKEVQRQVGSNLKRQVPSTDEQTLSKEDIIKVMAYAYRTATESAKDKQAKIYAAFRANDQTQRQWTEDQAKAHVAQQQAQQQRMMMERQMMPLQPMLMPQEPMMMPQEPMMRERQMPLQQPMMMERQMMPQQPMMMERQMMPLQPMLMPQEPMMMPQEPMMTERQMTPHQPMMMERQMMPQEPMMMERQMMPEQTLTMTLQTELPVVQIDQQKSVMQQRQWEAEQAKAKEHRQMEQQRQMTEQEQNPVRMHDQMIQESPMTVRQMMPQQPMMMERQMMPLQPMMMPQEPMMTERQMTPHQPMMMERQMMPQEPMMMERQMMPEQTLTMTPQTELPVVQIDQQKSVMQQRQWEAEQAKAKEHRQMEQQRQMMDQEQNFMRMQGQTIEQSPMTVQQRVTLEDTKANEQQRQQQDTVPMQQISEERQWAAEKMKALQQEQQQRQQTDQPGTLTGALVGRAESQMPQNADQERHSVDFLGLGGNFHKKNKDKDQKAPTIINYYQVIPKSSYGSGHESGYGSNYGPGYGSNHGSSYGPGYGSNHGSNYGSGHESGYGSNHGSNYGPGYGSNHGSSYGSDQNFGHSYGTSYGGGASGSNAYGGSGSNAYGDSGSNPYGAYRAAVGDDAIDSMLRQHQTMQAIKTQDVPHAPPTNTTPQLTTNSSSSDSSSSSSSSSTDSSHNIKKRLANFYSTSLPALHRSHSGGCGCGSAHCACGSSCRCGTRRAGQFGKRRQVRHKRSIEYGTLEAIDEVSLNALRQEYKHGLKEITLNPDEDPAEALLRHNTASIREALERANQEPMEISSDQLSGGEMFEDGVEYEAVPASVPVPVPQTKITSAPPVISSPIITIAKNTEKALPTVQYNSDSNNSLSTALGAVREEFKKLYSLIQSLQKQLTNAEYRLGYSTQTNEAIKRSPTEVTSITSTTEAMLGTLYNTTPKSDVEQKHWQSLLASKDYDTKYLPTSHELQHGQEKLSTESTLSAEYSYQELPPYDSDNKLKRCTEPKCNCTSTEQSNAAMQHNVTTPSPNALVKDYPVDSVSEEANNATTIAPSTVRGKLVRRRSTNLGLTKTANNQSTAALMANHQENLELTVLRARSTKLDELIDILHQLLSLQQKRENALPLISNNSTRSSNSLSRNDPDRLKRSGSTPNRRRKLIRKTRPNLRRTTTRRPITRTQSTLTSASASASTSESASATTSASTSNSSPSNDEDVATVLDPSLLRPYMGLLPVEQVDDPWTKKAFDPVYPLYTGGGSYETYLRPRRDTHIMPGSHQLLTPGMLERLLRIKVEFQQRFPHLYHSMLKHNAHQSRVVVTPPLIVRQATPTEEPIYELGAAERSLLDSDMSTAQNIEQERAASVASDETTFDKYISGPQYRPDHVADYFHFDDENNDPYTDPYTDFIDS